MGLSVWVALFKCSPHPRPAKTFIKRPGNGQQYNNLKNGFQQIFGCIAFDYLHRERLKEAAQQLRAGMPIKEVAYMQGYSSIQHFTRAFKKQFCITPESL